ncbi:MAG: gliding motility protein GldN [Saprospiraceae bacterium]|nr:gliding motility protein GldN [Saprospiraceae bacterium]MBK6564980.1 gliding motility protein GldN [Saprospiraceae bacterium]MBK6783124.1 gliding motility protein GldN [Saprospiraceae bacterium]MBK7523618.1 gliding motility protein GldN [Saprospiraceae bacterium]MBK8371391.1 gliding motility protein GldN [Saprospiraceae bacterium]
MKSFLILFFVTSLFSLSYNTSYAQAEKTESSLPSEDFFIDDIVDKRLIVENRVMDYQPIREADIAWEARIQRVIDTREKLNLPFRSQELNLFTTFIELVKNEELTVFSDEKFKNPLAKEDIDKKLSSLDTITDFDYDTYTEVIKVVKNDINWENIHSYRIKEIWFFDKETSTMRQQILGIAPIYASPKDQESGIPPSPLFWVYYPEARVPLAKYRVFNENNDIAPMTWTDLFDSRVFTSYIYKRSNVLDYRLKDYHELDPNAEVDMSGIDMLLHSDKIKNELFNFEHDLWEY